MRDRFDRLFWPLFGFLLYTGGLFFVFAAHRAISQPLRGFFLLLLLIFLAGLLAASFAHGLAVIQSRWPRFDLSPNKSFLACCIVLTFFSYFLHLFPKTTDLVLSEDELGITSEEGGITTLPPTTRPDGHVSLERLILWPKNFARWEKKREARNRYLDWSFYVAAVSWLGLLLMTFAAPATRARPDARTVALHPIVLVGLGAVFVASLVQAIS